VSLLPSLAWIGVNGSGHVWSTMIGCPRD